MSEVKLPTSITVDTELDEKSRNDLQVLKYISQKICAVLHTNTSSEHEVGPRSLILEKRHQRSHAITILDATPTWARSPLAFVGFVGERRHDANPQVRDELFKTDALLNRELLTMPGFLYYSSLQLSQKRWYNLVVLSHSDAQDHLRRSAIHRHAAYQLAPGYYEWIRLHQGLMPDGLSGQLVLRKTKHFTSHATEPHFSVRELAYAH